jgi:hypothetical protein
LSGASGKSGSAFLLLARAGFVARGVMYLLVAAAVLAAVAVAQLAMGRRLRFLHHVTPQAARHLWVKLPGAAGNCARG